MTAHRVQLDGSRWHFQHGPMDIVLAADGEPAAVAAAHEAAWDRFAPLLNDLVSEMGLLKRPVAGPCPLRGAVARRMWWACRPFRAGFITAMAAVAGAVADELIAAYERDGVDRAWVNNGGDIAVYLAPGQTWRVGVFSDLQRLDARQVRSGITTDGQFELCHDLPVRGVATSGWRGRSFSLGIADSVTVLAATAAQADAAATVIANAVDVTDPLIVRRPASELKDDTDLGEMPVTVDVPRLEPSQVRAALDAGLARAHALRHAGLIEACLLVCQGQVVNTEGPALTTLPTTIRGREEHAAQQTSNPYLQRATA